MSIEHLIAYLEQEIRQHGPAEVMPPTRRPASIKTVCAWCQTIVQDGPEDEGEVSHGICTSCAKEWAA